MGASENDVGEIYKLLREYKESKYLKKRSYRYVHDQVSNYVIIKKGSELFGAIEIIELTDNILELGSLVMKSNLEVSEKWRGVYNFIDFACKYAKKEGKQLISLTNMKSLAEIYIKHGFIKITPQSIELKARSEQSPGVGIYLFTTK